MIRIRNLAPLPHNLVEFWREYQIHDHYYLMKHKRCRNGDSRGRLAAPVIKDQLRWQHPVDVGGRGSFVFLRWDGEAGVIQLVAGHWLSFSERAIPSLWWAVWAFILCSRYPTNTTAATMERPCSQTRETPMEPSGKPKRVGEKHLKSG